MAGSAISPFALIGADVDLEQKVFYATDYGAVFDFQYGINLGTDNYTPIQNALDAAAAYVGHAGANRGAVVQLPAGEGRLADDSPSLTVSRGVWLRGQGPGAGGLYRYNGTGTPTNADSVIAVDANGGMVKISDFWIQDQCGEATTWLIDFGPQQQALGLLGGTVAEIERIVGQSSPSCGGGIHLPGGSIECRLLDCYVRTGDTGFKIEGTDNFILHCTADTCGGDGFLVASANCKIVGSKAFGCVGNGFTINGPRNMLTGCEAQDNGQTGFNAIQHGNVLTACVADTNNQLDASPGDPTSRAGFVLNSSVASGCSATNRSGTPQKYGYILQATEGSPLIQPAAVGCQSIAPGTEHVWVSSVGSIVVNNLLGTQAVGYASPLTPDPYLGGTVIVGTLTGAISINPPASGVFAGMRIAFQLTQDGSGGHAVTFDAGYKTTAAIPTTANHVLRIEFEWNGTNFREVARSEMAS